MADDASYNTFLNKVNQDPSSDTNASKNQSTSQSRSKFDPTSQPNDSVPAPLQDISQIYTSDTDSPFEPCFFSYSSDELPSISDFQKCLGIKGQGDAVEELSEEDFDPRGEYKDVIGKVKSVGNGGVKVFRVEASKTRVEYYIVTVGERKLVGVVAKAVES